jgi:hypothetical protein
MQNLINYFIVENFSSPLNNQDLKIEFKHNLVEIFPDLNILPTITIDYLGNYKNRLNYFSFNFNNEVNINSILYYEILKNQFNCKEKYIYQKINYNLLNLNGFDNEIKPIFIYFEKITYDSFSFYDKNSKNLIYFFSLENNFSPIIIREYESISFDKETIKEFQFENYTIEKLSQKLIKIQFNGVTNFTYEDIKFNLLKYLGGLLYLNSYQLISLNSLIEVENKKINIIPECDYQMPFIFIKTNIRYIEYPIVKDFILSIFENKMSFLINPKCKIERLEYQLEKITNYKNHYFLGEIDSPVHIKINNYEYNVSIYSYLI